jgi:O-antigen ligase
VFGGRRGLVIILGIVLYLVCLGLLAALGWQLVSQHDYETRGVWYGTPPDIPQAAVYPFGVNVSLERYEGEELDRALTMIRDGGFRWIRQRFPWSDIEAEQGRHDWNAWDRIVAAAEEHDLEIIAVLEATPPWARAPLDSATPQAPPQDFAHYADFVKAFAARYAGPIDYVQIWDEPNLYPHWGERYTDPAGYTHLLQAAYRAVKEAHPEAFVLTAGLAPNVEEGGRYMSDIRFLQKMYEAGARGYFDILAIKPYGLWYEPWDRRVLPQETNFSRPILLREVMVNHGDGDKAIWAVEFGWCALPATWTGWPAPWTSDSDEVQARRTVEAIERARDEWPWMGVLALQHFQPVAEADDPISGFSLITDDFEPRLTYLRVQELARETSIAYPRWYPADTWAAEYVGSWQEQAGVISRGSEGDSVQLSFMGTGLDLLVRPPLQLGAVTIDEKPAPALKGGSLRVDDGCDVDRVTLAKGLAYGEHLARLTVGSEGGGIAGFVVLHETSFARYYLSLVLLAGTGLVVGWRLVRLVLLPTPLGWWNTLAGWYLRRPIWQQIGLISLALGVYYFSPWLPVSLMGLALLVPLVYLRVDLGLAFAAFCIPFFLRPKVLLGQSLSLVELLTVLCFACWLLRVVARPAAELDAGTPQPLASFPFRSLASVRRLAMGFWRLVAQLVRTASALDVGVVFFFLVGLFSLTVSENRGVSIYELRTVIVGPVLFYLLLREAPLDDAGLTRVVDALVLGALSISLIGLYQYVAGVDVITAEGVRRIRGLYGSPNNLGLYLGRIVPIIVALLFFGGERRRKWGYLAAGVPVLGCLYLTHSRGAWVLGVPAALLFIGVLRGRRALLAAIGAAVAAVVALLPFAGAERIRTLFDLSGGTALHRLRLWQGTLSMIRDHPLWGVGLDNFLYQYPRYMLPEAWQEPDLSHPHNILLDWWTRLGIPGVGALIWMEVAFFMVALRLYRSLGEGDLRALIVGLMASMVDFLAHGLIDNSFFLVDLAFVFFLTVGIVRRLSLRSA